MPNAFFDAAKFQPYLTSFRHGLLGWHTDHARQLPWQTNRDPYSIWLFEVILQQTRIEQGWPYYQRFLAAFPTVFDLANAPDDQVFKLWEGLGYYSRARNLLATARLIVAHYQGVFPQTYAELRTLKGVGAYTAAAIASFAFDLPYAVLDGNVFRVLARFFGCFLPQDSPAGKQFFQNLADAALIRDRPGLYNQAIMDFGALQCVPRNPNCRVCPLASSCQAHQNDQVEQLPVKTKKLIKKKRYFQYLYLPTPDGVLVQRRSATDIWAELYELPLLETPNLVTEVAQLDLPSAWQELLAAPLHPIHQPLQQILTHQIIVAQFWTLPLAAVPAHLPPQWQWVSTNTLSQLAFPRIITRFFQEKSLNLRLF